MAPFLALTALPSSLARAEQLARAVYTGWRPPSADGPSRDELVVLAQRAPIHRGFGNARCELAVRPTSGPTPSLQPDLNKEQR